MLFAFTHLPKRINVLSTHPLPSYLSVVDPTLVAPLLSAERLVEVLNSLLPRFSSLSTVEGGALLSSLDLAAEERSYYETPLKSKRPRLNQSSLKDTSFLTPSIVDPTVELLSLQPESFMHSFASL